MAKTINQDIPSEMADAYDTSLHRAAIWIPGSSIRMVRKRVPFYMGHMQNSSTQSPSAAQRLVRAAFKKSCNCFGAQPATGGVTPPTIGPRNRSWWYDAAAGSGLWYYDYFIQQSWPDFYANNVPDWCNMVDQELLPIARNEVRKGEPGTVFQTSALPRAGFYNEWPESWGYLLYDVSSVSGKLLNFANLSCWLLNEITFDTEAGVWRYQTGYIYIWHGYYNPATLTWNNKPGLRGLVTTRLTPSAWLFEEQANIDRSIHNFNLYGLVRAAADSEVPYITVAYKVGPKIEGEFGDDIEWWLGSLIYEEQKPILHVR